MKNEISNQNNLLGLRKRLEIVRKNNFQDKNLEMESDDRVPDTS